jgi:uncharacterized membrane protein YecN with MAPEG domain
MRSKREVNLSVAFILLSIPVAVVLALAGAEKWLVIICAAIFVVGGVILLFMAVE